MTVRAVFIGMVLALAMACGGFANDIWLGLSPVGGDLFPIWAYGLLMAAVLGVNPLLRVLRAPLRAGELVTILAMTLMGSVIGGSGLMWVFPAPVIAPLQEMARNSALRPLMEYVPTVEAFGQTYSPLLVNAPYDSAVVSQYTQGMSSARGLVSPWEIPWGAWWPTLTFWGAVLGLSFAAALAAAVVVHRQWSQREHLSYPLVTVMNELIEPPQPGRRLGPIFSNGTFWLGLLIALGVLLVNGYAVWNPKSVKIPTGINLGALRTLLPNMAATPWTRVFEVNLYFGGIGLAYFLSSEASFSLGISDWLYTAVAAALIAAGVNMQQEVLAGGLPGYSYFGAYTGLTLMVLYLGRRFYGALLRRAVFLPAPAGEVLPREVAACRVLLACIVALTALLWWIGLHPLLGLAFVLLTGSLFLMLGRIHVSTGLFITQPFWNAGPILVAMLGPLAVGPQGVLILAMLSVVLTIDPRIAVLPLALGAIKLGDRRDVAPGRLAGWMGVAVVVALVAGVLVTVWFYYAYGQGAALSSSTRWGAQVGRMPFDMLDKAVADLRGREALAAAREPVTIGRLLPRFLGGTAGAVDHFWPAFGVGLGLVLLCSAARLRWAKWPLHPVLFLVWGSPWTSQFAPSFLVAWFVKSQIMRYGGQPVYNRLRPLFIGLIAGELIAGVFWGAMGLWGYFGPLNVLRPFDVRP